MSVVAVVGGGVIGSSIAWRAARAGHTVTVHDAGIERGASWVAAGMLAPVTEVHFGEDELLSLNMRSAAMWPTFAHELTADAGTLSGFHPSGALTVARDRDDLEALEAVAAYQRELGLDVARLTARECRTAEPWLAPSVRGGFLVAGDHHVDNRMLLGALRAACAAHGVRIVDGAVDLPEGEVVVVASGASAATGAFGLPALRAVKGQILRLAPAPGAATPVLHHIVRGVDAYLVGRTSSGEVVVGATMEEKGLDTTVTAGAVHELLESAFELVPGLREMELREASAGTRPGTFDNLPLVGATANPNVIAALGHYRNGFLLAPVTADIVLHVLETGGQPEWASAVDPSRFSEL